MNEATANAVINPPGEQRRKNELISAIFKTWGAKSVVSWPHSVTGNWAIMAYYGPNSLVYPTWIPADRMQRQHINQVAAELYFEYKDSL